MTRNAECRMPNAEFRMPNSECRIPNSECRMPNAECRIRYKVIGKLRITNYELSGVGRLSANLSFRLSTDLINSKSINKSINRTCGASTGRILADPARDFFTAGGLRPDGILCVLRGEHGGSWGKGPLHPSINKPDNKSISKSINRTCGASIKRIFTSGARDFFTAGGFEPAGILCGFQGIKSGSWGKRSAPIGESIF